MSKPIQILMYVPEWISRDLKLLLADGIHYELVLCTFGYAWFTRAYWAGEVFDLLLEEGDPVEPPIREAEEWERICKEVSTHALENEAMFNRFFRLHMPVSDHFEEGYSLQLIDSPTQDFILWELLKL